MKLFRKCENFAQLGLPVLALVFAFSACSSKKPAEPAPDTGEAQAANTTPEEKMVFEGPGELLPKQVDGWKISSAPRYFGPDNLYDLINGGAEVFVDYGLEKMVTADYTSDEAKSKTVTVEIYNQGSPKGAFGRLSRYLSEQQDPSKAGEGLPEGLEERGILGAGDLKVWKGPYLVHVTLLDESADATEESISEAGKKILPQFANEILADIEQVPPAPEILAAFPERDRIDRSQSWTPKAVAGIEVLGPGFTARYRAGEEQMTLFVTEELASKEAAKKAAEKASESEEIIAYAEGKRVVGGRTEKGKPKKNLITKVKAFAEAVAGE